MYAIAFDLEIAELKKCYGDPYNGAYQEIGKELKFLGFDWAQGSVCLSHIRRTTWRMFTKPLTVYQELIGSSDRCATSVRSKWKTGRTLRRLSKRMGWVKTQVHIPLWKSKQENRLLKNNLRTLFRP